MGDGGLMAEEHEPLMLFAASLVGMSDGKPKVDITVPGGRQQLSYDEAVNFARSILRSAEASIVDAFVFNWLQSKVKLKPEVAIRIMMEFRDFRAEHDPEMTQ